MCLCCAGPRLSGAPEVLSRTWNWSCTMLGSQHRLWNAVKYSCALCTSQSFQTAVQGQLCDEHSICLKWGLHCNLCQHNSLVRSSIFQLPVIGMFCKLYWGKDCIFSMTKYGSQDASEMQYPRNKSSSLGKDIWILHNCTWKEKQG